MDSAYCLWIFYLWILISVKNTFVNAVCSLETGQNAVYWWIPEDRAPGSVIDTLPIEGNASGKWANIELSLVYGTQWFTLDSQFKHLVLKQAVDRDFGDVRLDAIVECRSLLPGDHDFRVNISVNVKIQDVNDNAPLFDTVEYRFNVTEELPTNTVVFSGMQCIDLRNAVVNFPSIQGIRAVDADQAGANSEIVYGILDDGLISSSLLIFPNPWEGTLAVNKRIDYEQFNNFSFAIIARDNGFPAMTSTALVYVTIQDVDDQNPQFEHERYTANAAADAVLGSNFEIFPSKIKAFDVDTLNATLTYSLSGTDSDSFEINAQSADIILKKPLSNSKNYLLTVHARQKDRPERQAAAVLVVRVLNKSPKRRLQFSSPTFKIRISESTPVNSQILKLTLAEEMDAGSVLLYSIRNKNESHFRIDQEKGTLWLVDALDYENRKEHRLRIGVTDGNQSSEADVSISVENANDNSPTFDHASYAFFINGTADEIHGSIGTVTAIDEDEMDRISYKLLNLNDIFIINDLGQLRVKDASKLANRSYELVIAATDSGNPPRVGHAIAKVEILDKARWQSAGGHSVVGKASTIMGGGTFLLVTVLAAVLLALIVTVLLLAFYICRLRRKKRRTLLSSANKRRQADGIIIANPVDAPSRPRQNSSTAQNAHEPITPNTDGSETSIFPIITPQTNDAPLTIDTNNTIEYSIPFVQSKHPGVILRRALAEENRESNASLNRATETNSNSILRPNSWSAAKPPPSLTVYF